MHKILFLKPKYLKTWPLFYAFWGKRHNSYEEQRSFFSKNDLYVFIIVIISTLVAKNLNPSLTDFKEKKQSQRSFFQKWLVCIIIFFYLKFIYAECGWITMGIYPIYIFLNCLIATTLTTSIIDYHRWENCLYFFFS